MFGLDRVEEGEDCQNTPVVVGAFKDSHDTAIHTAAAAVARVAAGGALAGPKVVS